MIVSRAATTFSHLTFSLNLDKRHLGSCAGSLILVPCSGDAQRGKTLLVQVYES
jgi:hypothetical protein